VTLPESEKRLTEPLLSELLVSLDGWRAEGPSITKTYTFDGFTAAMAFANRVAGAANAANHHPDVHIEGYKTVRIVLTTHATGGISRADIDLANAIDAVAA
jgi:4a-hydroxytetrahydrobiopterin dehydratase